MNIGLIAHDSKKKLMQNFCIAYRGILNKHELYATGTTGRLIEEVTNLNVHKYLAGHLGGQQQLASQIEHNDMDMVIYLRDPLHPKKHEPDVHGASQSGIIPTKQGGRLHSGPFCCIIVVQLDNKLERSAPEFGVIRALALIFLKLR